MTRNVTEIQQRLITLGFLAPLNDSGLSNADGKFGVTTLGAYNRFRASKGEPPHTGLLLLVEVSADVFPEDAPPPKPPSISIFDQIGTLVSIINLLKGKTMTADQITGVIRTVLAAGLAYLAGKGLIPVVPPDLVAGLVTVIVGVWSLYSNRAKTIVPLADK